MMTRFIARLVVPIVVARLEDGLLAAHELRELVGAEAGAVVLQEIDRPWIVAAADFGALRRVIDRVGEVALLLQQQRIGLFEIEGDRIVALDLDLVRRVAGRERPSGTGPVP